MCEWAGIIRPEERVGEGEESPDERGDSCFARAIVEGSRGAGRDVRNRLEGVVADGEETRVAGGVTDDGGLALVGGSTPGETT